jgi:hypothetical protein
MAIISGGRIIEGARVRGGAMSAEVTAGAPAVYGALRGVRVRYDFAVEGGGVGTIGLAGATVVPSGAVVLGGFVDVVTPPTSGGAGTLALQVEAAGDLVAAAAVSGAPWSTTGRKSVLPVFTGASSLKTTAARDISAVIAAAALTAGVVDVYLFYVETV